MKFRCLCCGQLVRETMPMTEDRAPRALAFLERLGFTRESLLGKHRANIDYCSPGFSEWLERAA